MIERKDVQGNTIFIDHYHGEIHFSDKSNIIRLAFGQDMDPNELFPDLLFGEFRIPITAGYGNNDEQVIEEHQMEAESSGPDEMICNSFNETTLTNIVKSEFKTSGTDSGPEGYDDILASDDIPHIVDSIVNSPYADVLLHLSPKKLMAKDRLMRNMKGNQGVLDELISFGFFKENQRGELFFTFKGLVIRGELAKTSNQDSIQIPAQSIIAQNI